MELTDLPDEPTRVFRLIPDWIRVRRVMYMGMFVILAMVTQYMVNAADTMMVGRLADPQLATASQAALGLGMPLFWAVGGFFSAVSFGTQAITARRYAEGNDHATGQVLFNSLLAAIICGLLGTAVGWFSAPGAVDFFAEASEAQKALGLEYVQIRALGIIGMVLTFSYKSFFDGIGRTYVHLVAALAMNFFNIALNYVLIFGVESWGIESMELAGAAWASTISTFLGLGIMILISMRGSYRKRFAFYRPRNFDPRVMGNIIKLLLPSGSASVILMTGFLLFMKFVGQIDAEAGGDANTFSAATKAVMDTAAFCFMPLLALGTATATAVSQSLGAKKMNLAASYGWETVRLCAWVMLAVGAAFWIFPDAVLTFWAPNDPAVVEAGRFPLRLVGCSLPMMAMGLILSQALYGAGANTYVMVAEGLLHFGLFVPLAWLLGPKLHYGINGIWTAAIVYVVGLGIVMGAKFATKGWRAIQL